MNDTKRPAIAGIAAFAVNISLALLLSGPMKGGGIALALSLASAVNTAFLFIFLRSNKNIDLAPVLKEMLIYLLKIIVLSAIAVLPVLLAGPRLDAAFAGHNRLISRGLPFALSCLLFGLVGVLGLVLTRDKTAGSLVGAFKRKKY
jgi:putative peptidoglycan lipid II flippase